MPPAKKPAAKARASGGGAGKKVFPDVRLENTLPGHSKFWSIHLEGTSTIIHYGKIGEDPGRVSGPKDHTTRKKAEAFYTKQIKSKLKKGYHDTAVNEVDEAEPAGKKRKAPVAGPSRKVQKQDVDPKHFVWGCSGGNSAITDGGFICKKGNGKESVGVRSREPLPKRITWSVSWSTLGSHQAAGVSDVSAPLIFDGYGFVFGEKTDRGESWAVCFTRVLDEFHIRHEGHEVEDFPCGLKWKPGFMPKWLVQLIFRREDSKLFVTLPGSKDEHLIVSDLPDADLFAVASTPYREAQIVIQDPTKPKPLPDLSPSSSAPKPAPPRKEKKTYPKCPEFAAGDSTGSMRQAMAGIGDGKWGLELVEKTDLMWKSRGKFMAPNEKQKADMSFVMKHGLAFHDAASLEECFSERNCDDGIISCYKLKCDSMSLTYYEGGFGGNSIGWALLEEGGVTKLVACNCDGDVTWEGPDKTSHSAKQFTKELRKIRYDD